MTQRTTPTTRLGEILETEGRTQAWLARATKIQPSQISGIVNGHRGDLDKRTAIATALGRTVEDVFGDRPDLAEAA